MALHPRPIPCLLFTRLLQSLSLCRRYGVIVNDIGMCPMIDVLLHRVLRPIAAALMPTEQGATLDTHRSFVVQYKVGEDRGLDLHTDNSDVTFNICLGKRFTGAKLTFCGHLGHPTHRQFSAEYTHRRGRCLVHLGQQRHGANDIESGERFNLIIWCRSFAFRQSDAYRRASMQASRRLCVGRRLVPVLAITPMAGWLGWLGGRASIAAVPLSRYAVRL